ncbi:transcription-associated protein 1-like isoform X2 [Daktulosphaira vitifoliae]|nr:transcription-associated protein 1-like isoform X2 [Daktulosphaira vitifoliae]XP_050530944.1 transcription-associated protein 1-like isoform X2 [Daktulosphaira vitifoliae]XP_050530945.1 transcription-associated protein 1-like isoform X2 [Daktulosphaira vitifoliae]
MEPVCKVTSPKSNNLIDLQQLLNPTTTVKIKLQCVQKISDCLEECCRNQVYFESMITVFLKVLSATEPVFTPDHDVFKIRKLILQIIHKICSSTEKIKNHVHTTMVACLKVIETDNEQCVIYCLWIFKELLNSFKPKFEGCLKTEIVKCLQLIINIYNNSSHSEKILSFQKTSDIKTLMNTVRSSTTVTKNAISYVIIPMGKISVKVLKELPQILKIFYMMYYGIQSFKSEMIEFFPTLISFFNLEIPYKAEYRDLVLDLKYAQVRLLPFFSLFLKENRDAISVHCTTLAGRIIHLMGSNIFSDVSNLRTELLTGFESIILADHKSEFLPHMDKFLDESLITGKGWSLKSILRPKAYIYIDHLITHLHNQLSLNYLVRVVHLHFTNILDPTLQPEVQINLCNMVMNMLNYIIQRQNQIITNINTVESNMNPIIDVFYRALKIFVLKLKQFHKLYLPQIKMNYTPSENNNESISKILAECQLREKERKFSFGYHSSQIIPYTSADCNRFIKTIIPAIKTILQFIVKTEGVKISVKHYNKDILKHFIELSFLSLKVYNFCDIKKKEMSKEVLDAIVCINPTQLNCFVSDDYIIQQIYSEQLEDLIFSIALADELLTSTFSPLIFDYILNNMENKKKFNHVTDLVNRLQLSLKINNNEELTTKFISQIIQNLIVILKKSYCPFIYLQMLKKCLIIVESAEDIFRENIISVLQELFLNLVSYQKSIADGPIKILITELCIAECLYKEVIHTHTIQLLNIVVYSLEVPQLAVQGIGVLECCINILPNNVLDESTLHIRSKIVQVLCKCLSSPYDSISHPAVSLLGKFGGLNRNAIIKPYQFSNKHKKDNPSIPKITVSFQGYLSTSLDLDISNAVNTAVEILKTKSNQYYRKESWNIIKGFFNVSLQCDAKGILNVLTNIKWNKKPNAFVKTELNYLMTELEETYITALTGLMICFGDDCFKSESCTLFSETFKRMILLAICYHSNIHSKEDIGVHPFVLIDAITNILSFEDVTVLNVGILATEMILRASHSILGDTIVQFPLISYLLKCFCELCYDIDWLHKRGGCMGLKVLYSHLLKKKSEENILPLPIINWFYKNLSNTFKAMMFIFADYNNQLTFGVIEQAQCNLIDLMKWVFSINHDTTDQLKKLEIEKIMRLLIDYIVGPNELLREQANILVDLLSELRNLTVFNMFEAYNEMFKLAIPGKQPYNTYNYNNQLGVMKGHIFCMKNKIPAGNLDFSNQRHKEYFYVLCNICECSNKDIPIMSFLKSLSASQVQVLRKTALQVLVNCRQFVKPLECRFIYKLLYNALKGFNLELQETAYECLKLCVSDSNIDLTIVDELLLYHTNLFQDYSMITMSKVKCVYYLSKLFPNRPNTIFCTTLLDIFKYIWTDLHYNKIKTVKYDHETLLVNIIEVISIIIPTEFCHIEEICEIILNRDIVKNELRIKLYPLLLECLLKFPSNSVLMFFREKNIKKPCWSSFLHEMINNSKCQEIRNVLTSNSNYIESLLASARIDPSKIIQYECIKTIYNLTKMEKDWISPSKSIVSMLQNMWINPQYKDRYKNLSLIKSTEWDEPKMMLKILLEYFRNNREEIQLLFQLLTVFNCQYPTDIHFFRVMLENEIASSFPIFWKRKVFFEFIELYQNKNSNNDILSSILQYIILPCFSNCYKKGEKEELLCLNKSSEENIIDVFLNKIFINIRTALLGYDFDGIKIYVCQLICLLIEDLLKFDEKICDSMYNAVIPCTWVRCSMDINVKFHCYLILTCIMLSENTSKREKLNQGIYYELLKASFAEAQPVINHALNLIVSAVWEKNNEVNTLVVCVKKIMMTESQNVPTLHHICSFLIKYNSLFYPYKQFLIRNILGALFPIAKNNNVPEYKKTAIELACMVIKWELTNSDENIKLKFPLKRKIEDTETNVNNKEEKSANDTLQPRQKGSSETIDNCLNFLAMVGCQTHDDKQESSISQLAARSVKLFKNILSNEAINLHEVTLKFGWIEKLLETFLKKENLIIQNPSAIGNSNASVMNLVTTFDVLCFMLNVLSKKLMLEAVKPLQDYLIKFLQLAYKETQIGNNGNPQKDSTNNRLSIIQIKQYNEGAVNVVVEILKAFPTSEGLEKLHIYVKLIITEGIVNNKCPYKMALSLTLLKAAQLNYPHYLENDIMNLIGDLLFRFDKNNRKTKIKIECLEILKNHVKNLPKFTQRIFFEKVLIVLLNNAKDYKNNMPVEVQIKCLDLVYIFLGEMPGLIEEVLLKSSIIDYIKNTTDERIITIILKIIKKWIELCEDESVPCNNNIVYILKYIIAIGHFPNSSELCHNLNIDIYKRWFYNECIDHGLKCSVPSIRREFFNIFESTMEKTLYYRLYSIINNLTYLNGELSAANYLQLLLVLTSKSSILQGNFSLLKINNSISFHSTLKIPDRLNWLKETTLETIQTYDICNSLSQLCFIDNNLAKKLWISIIPSIWKLFSNIQRKSLAHATINYLEISHHGNDFSTILYESFSLCEPKINFKPHQLVHIGKTYNLWHRVIIELENMLHTNLNESHQNEIIHALSKLYSLLNEYDFLEAMYQNILERSETKSALFLEHLGDFKNASEIYTKLIYRESNKCPRIHFCHQNFFEQNVWKTHLFKCLRELNEWEYISDVLSNDDCFLLNIESVWKKSPKSSYVHHYNLMLDYLEKNQFIWPTKTIWKYHFYLSMIALNQLTQKCISTAHEHINLATKEIIDNWKSLPYHVCNVHIPLLQATQLVVETREAHCLQSSWLYTQENMNNIDVLVETWNDRTAWIGDDLSFWKDIDTWRQTYYSFLTLRNANIEMPHTKIAQIQSELKYCEAAFSHKMFNICLNSLEYLSSKEINLPNWLYKLNLEIKCLKEIEDEGNYRKKDLLNHMESTFNESFSNEIKSIYYALKGSLYNSCDEIERAFIAYINSATFQSNLSNKETDWNSVIENHFISNCTGSQKISEEKNKSDNLIENCEIIGKAWTEWGKLLENKFLLENDVNYGLSAIKCYIIALPLVNKIHYNFSIARIIWLLTYDNINNMLLLVLERCNICINYGLWMPQMLNTLVDKDCLNIENIILQAAHNCPQTMYLTLRKMYVNEKVQKEKKISILKNQAEINAESERINKKMHRIKKFMSLLQNKNLVFIQLEYFVQHIFILGESWDEELRRNLYECLSLCYEHAYLNKSLNVPISTEIYNFISNVAKSFCNQSLNPKELMLKKPFSIPDKLSQFYESFKKKFSHDFSSPSMSVETMTNYLGLWIKCLEKFANYQTVFLHESRCPGIHNIDWSMIKLPGDLYYSKETSSIVKIQNFSGFVHLIDKDGTIVKQLNIRGTDGFEYSYIVSKGEFNESEQRIHQIFFMTNSLLYNYKETARRNLKYFVPRMLTLSPYLRIVEGYFKNLSLLSIYNKINKSSWINEDIDSYFSILKKCLESKNPLKNTFDIMQKNLHSKNFLTEWTEMNFETPSDNWIFRKTFVEYYSLLCFSEYTFGLTKLKPEMLNINKECGTLNAEYYAFSRKNIDQPVPFRMTSSLKKFITFIRKKLFINCTVASAQCFHNSREYLGIMLKILLYDELKDISMFETPVDGFKNSNKQDLLRIITNNVKDMLTKINELSDLSTNNIVEELLLKASSEENIYLESPTWRPWL